MTASLRSAGDTARRKALRWPFPAKAIVPARFSANRRNLYVLGDQVVYSFGNMMVAAMLSRHCTALQFGIYILTQRAMDVLIQLSNVFLWTPMVFRLPGMSPAEQERYRGSIIALQGCFCAIFSLLLLGLAGLTRHNAHLELPSTFAPLVPTAGVLLFREFLRRFLFAHLRFPEAFWTDCVTVVLQIVGVACLHWANCLSLSTALLALAIGAFAVIPWWLAGDWNDWRLDLYAVFPDLVTDFRMGRWFFGSNLVFLASAQCNPWLLSTVLGGASVGNYAICESLINIPRAALASAENLLGPKLARVYLSGGKRHVRTQVTQLERKLIAGAAGCTTLLWVVGPAVSFAIYGRAPGALRLVTLLLAMNLVAYASTLGETFGLAALGRPDISVAANVVGLSLQIAVSAVFIRGFGATGAAGALLLGTIMSAIVRRVWYGRVICGVGTDAQITPLSDALLS